MSNIPNTKRKLKVLSMQGVPQMIYDAVSLCTKDYDLLPSTIAIFTEHIIEKLENQYKSEIPKKQPKSKQIDIEDSIREITEKRIEYKRNEYDKSTETDTGECKENIS